MPDFAALTTDQLIDLLYQEEDRVTLEHIQTLAQRGAEALPRLREIYQNEDFWYEGTGGNHFIIVHALILLALNRQPEDGALLMRHLMDAYFSSHEWAMEYLPSALAEFGPQMIDPLMQWIVKERGAEWDNSDYGQARYACVVALARIADAHLAERERVFQFISQQFNEPKENSYFLSHACDSLVFLDRKRGLPIVKAAFERKAVNRDMLGTYSQYVTALDSPDGDRQFDFECELLDFYDPELIESRQQRWAEEAAHPTPLYWEPGTDPHDHEHELEAPAGYEITDTGNIVRGDKVGRNDPCPCGSGKKYKKCHG